MTAETPPPNNIQHYLALPHLERPEKPLAKQWALVTGATRFNGLGFAIAERLAFEGASIVVVGTENSQSIAPYVVQRLESYGVRAHSLVADVTSEQSCIQMVGEVYKLAGGNVNILVNNAGKNIHKALPDVTLAIFNQVFGPKALGAFLVTREWFKIRNRKGLKGGRLVNIGSPIGTLYGAYGNAPYAMANGAIFGLTQDLALELGSRSVTANVIVPTFVEGTEITAGFEDQIPAIKATTPNGELPLPQDIGGAVAYLVGPDGSRINGIVLPIDNAMKSNYTALQPLTKARFRQVPQHGLKIIGDLSEAEAMVIAKMRQQAQQGIS